MRDTLITLMLVLPGALLLTEIVYGVRLRRFVGRVDAVRTDAQRREFQAIERLGETIAGFVKPTMTAASVLFAFGLFADHLELGDLLYAIGPNVPIFLFSLWLKPTEARANEMKAEMVA